jgi:FkbM family methyltransferase
MSIRLNRREKFITSLLAYFPFLMSLLDYSKKISFLSPHDKDYWVLHQIIGKDTNIKVLDVGANIGQSAVGFRKLYPAASIHAFEANPDLAKSLLNLQDNGTIDKITIAFVGSDNGDLIEFYAPMLRGYLFSTFASFDLNGLQQNLQGMFPKRIFDRFEFQKYESNLISLDSLNLPLVDLIKIDVEGYELSVLAGATKLMERCKPVIFLEINSEELFQSIWNFVTPMNYKLFAINKQQIQEISSDQFARQITRNFLLLNRMPF